MASEFFSAFLLAIVQGITEWLPISSSGHLILFENIFGFFRRGLLFDVALHFGTLMAVFVYFGRDIVDILQDFLSGKWKTENGKTGVYLVVASIPAAIVGFFLAKIFDSVLTDMRIVAVGFAITGVLLIISGVYKVKGKDSEKMSYKKAFLIGLAQVFSIIPGISRSGATISSGLILGLSEKKAMRFSFLMSIPIIFGASVFSLGSAKIPSEFVWASLVSFLIGLLTIHLLFNYVLVKRKNMVWFGVYTLILSAGILLWFLFN